MISLAEKKLSLVFGLIVSLVFFLLAHAQGGYGLAILISVFILLSFLIVWRPAYQQEFMGRIRIVTIVVWGIITIVATMTPVSDYLLALIWPNLHSWLPTLFGATAPTISTNPFALIVCALAIVGLVILGVRAVTNSQNDSRNRGVRPPSQRWSKKNVQQYLADVKARHKEILLSGHRAVAIDDIYTDVFFLDEPAQYRKTPRNISEPSTSTSEPKRVNGLDLVLRGGNLLLHGKMGTGKALFCIFLLCGECRAN